MHPSTYMLILRHDIDELHRAIGAIMRQDADPMGHRDSVHLLIEKVEIRLAEFIRQKAEILAEARHTTWAEAKARYPALFSVSALDTPILLNHFEDTRTRLHSLTTGQGGGPALREESRAAYESRIASIIGELMRRNNFDLQSIQQIGGLKLDKALICYRASIFRGLAPSNATAPPPVIQRPIAKKPSVIDLTKQRDEQPQ